MTSISSTQLSAQLTRALTTQIGQLDGQSQAGQVAGALLQALQAEAPDLAREISSLIGMAAPPLPKGDMSAGLEGALARMAQLPPGAAMAGASRAAGGDVGLAPPPAENYMNAGEIAANLDATLGAGTSGLAQQLQQSFQRGEAALALSLAGAGSKELANILGRDNPETKNMVKLIKRAAKELSRNPPNEAAAERAIMEAHYGFIKYAAPGDADTQAKLKQLFKEEYGIDEPGNAAFTGQGPLGGAASAAGIGNNTPPPHGSYEVKKGDSLWKIAQMHYGDGSKWPLIAQANGLPTTGNPVIYPGQKFKVPGGGALNASGGISSGGSAGVDSAYPTTGGAGPGPVGLGALRAAQSQVGVREATGNNDGIPSQRYMNGRKEPWCANFVAWSFRQAGQELPGNQRSLASVQYMEDQMKAAGKWHARDASPPQPGDIIFFKNRGDSDSGPGRHVGIVERVENGRVYTIEGNSSNAVSRRSYPVDHPRISGWGRMDSAPPPAVSAPAGAAGEGVNAQQLKSIVPSLSDARAQQLVPHLNNAMAEAGIDTKNEQAAFIAQLAHESAGFKYWEEIASGSAYEGRRDLGNTQPGDGVRFKGRGPIQLTGRANYEAAGKALGLDLVGNPEQVENPDVGFRVAAWYWNSRNLNQYAGTGTLDDFNKVTYRINGGYNGKQDRINYWQRAMNIL